MQFDLNVNVFDENTAAKLKQINVPFEAELKLSKVLCQLLINAEERQSSEVKAKRFAVLSKFFAAMNGDGKVELDADEVGTVNGAVDAGCSTLMHGIIKRILSNPVAKAAEKT